MYVVASFQDPVDCKKFDLNAGIPEICMTWFLRKVEQPTKLKAMYVIFNWLKFSFFLCNPQVVLLKKGETLALKTGNVTFEIRAIFFSVSFTSFAESRADNDDDSLLSDELL